MAKKQAKEEISIVEAVQQFCAERAERGVSISKEAVLNIIRDSLATAYKKKLGIEDENSLRVEFVDKNEVSIIIKKQVVEGSPKHALEISLNDAKLIYPNCQIGDILEFHEKPIDSRIISNQARQLVFQKIREIEIQQLYKEYKAKEGELTHGYFQRFVDRDVMSIDLGKLDGIMPKREQNPNERFKPGDRLKAIISKVEIKKDKHNEPTLVVTLSRASGDFVKKLFEMEIPEIYDGLVQIVDIARVPGIRTKIVVKATRGDIDPVGACVGMKGVRIQSIVRELGNERIDIIQYSEDIVDYLVNLISPAKPVEIKVDSNNKEALIVVPDDALSLAIGTNGSNVKLASQISKYKLDIKSLSNYNETMTTPEARAQLEKLFQPRHEEPVQTEDEGMSLKEIPGLSQRVINLLESAGIKNVETLIEMNPTELARIPGIGKTTAEQILNILKETVELVDE